MEMPHKGSKMMISNEQWLRYGEITEHDACGIGAVADIRGRQSRGIVEDALKIVEKLEHRAGKDALGETGDGKTRMDFTHEGLKSEQSLTGHKHGWNSTADRLEAWLAANPD